MAKILSHNATPTNPLSNPRDPKQGKQLRLHLQTAVLLPQQDTPPCFHPQMLTPRLQQRKLHFHPQRGTPYPQQKVPSQLKVSHPQQSKNLPIHPPISSQSCPQKPVSRSQQSKNTPPTSSSRFLHQKNFLSHTAQQNKKSNSPPSSPPQFLPLKVLSRLQQLEKLDSLPQQSKRAQRHLLIHRPDDSPPSSPPRFLPLKVLSRLQQLKELDSHPHKSTPPQFVQGTSHPKQFHSQRDPTTFNLHHQQTTLPLQQIQQKTLQPTHQESPASANEEHKLSPTHKDDAISNDTSGLDDLFHSGNKEQVRVQVSYKTIQADYNDDVRI